MKKNKIVIIGGGFGGLTILRKLQHCLDLKKNEILLINKENYFLFTPMIHEVASGGLDRNNVVEPIRELLDGAVFVQDIVTKIDLKKKAITLDTHPNIDYDYLVIATGAENNYYNIKGAQEYTIPLKTLENAVNIKRTILKTLEHSMCCEQNSQIDFVVIGGGPTGVELIAEISELIQSFENNIGDKCNKNKYNLSLICGPSMLGHLNEELQKYTEKYLKTLKINIYHENAIEVLKNKVILEKTGVIPASATFWAAGVKPSLPIMAQTIEKDKSERIITDQYLRVLNYENVLAIGDIVSGWPMLAYTATRQADTTAQNINAMLNSTKLKKFEFTPKVALVSLGQKNAVGNFYGINLKGRSVWFLWRTIYLAKIISVKQKIKIALNWTFNLFTDRDISQY